MGHQEHLEGMMLELKLKDKQALTRQGWMSSSREKCAAKPQV